MVALLGSLQNTGGISTKVTQTDSSLSTLVPAKKSGSLPPVLPGTVA